MAHQTENKDLTLRVFIHDEHALTVAIEQAAWARAQPIRETGPALSSVSALWAQREPEGRELETWLAGCLPENGALVAYVAQTHAMLHRRLGNRADATPHVAAVLWANTDAEYCGAAEFRRVDEAQRPPAAPTRDYQRLDESDIHERLEAANHTADNARTAHSKSYAQRRASLSGVRGKFALTRDTRGQWCAAPHGSLNTWIAKHEHSARAPGEAGVESVSQDAMALLGLRSAQTLARVFVGTQCVLSERADRHWSAHTGLVAPLHQEEFCQAVGWPATQKYDTNWPSEPRWPAAYEILRCFAPDIHHEQNALTRILAAAWLIGNGDMHRRNLGFALSAPAQRKSARIAALYDVSSSIDTRFDRSLAIAVARQRNFTEIGPRHWLWHAKESNVDPQRVLAIVRETARAMPDAIASARTRARERDENVLQHAVDRRLDAMLDYCAKRARTFEAELTRVTKKRNLVIPEETQFDET